MAQWKGQSKGTITGYKIFIFFIKKVGIGSAYFLLYFVSFYYFIFSVKGNKASFYYFRKRLKYSWFKSLISVYKNIYVFGQTLIDKVAISSGLKNKFTYNYNGRELLNKLLEEKKAVF